MPSPVSSKRQADIRSVNSAIDHSRFSIPAAIAEAVPVVMGARAKS
jgi:hypothetical protein